MNEAKTEQIKLWTQGVVSAAVWIPRVRFSQFDLQMRIVAHSLSHSHHELHSPVRTHLRYLPYVQDLVSSNSATITASNDWQMKFQNMPSNIHFDQPCRQHTYYTHNKTPQRKNNYKPYYIPRPNQT
jgi:hypothetical protein